MEELRLNTEEVKGNTLLRLVSDSTIGGEGGDEFSLPDYVPEIRKLLYVKARALPESKYISDSGENTTIELGGTLTYLVIYTDDEGELRALPLSCPYEAKGTLMSHPTEIFIDTVVDSVSTRVNAPRKITIKCRLKNRVLGWEEREEKEKIDGKTVADELFIERLSTSVKTASLKQISMQGVKLSDKLDIEAAAQVNPIWCDADLSIRDVKAQNNIVSVRGDVSVKCVCESGGETVILTKKLPLAEEIDAKGATAGDMARVSGRCVSLAISNGQSGDTESLFFDLDCELEGAFSRNTELQLTRDCYSTRCESEERYKEIDVYSMLKAQNTSFTVNESAKRKSRELNEIIDIMWDPVYEKTEIKSGKAVHQCKLNVTLIGKGEKNEDGEFEYVSEACELPVKFATDLGKYDGELIFCCQVSASNVSARLDNDKVQISAELYPSVEIIEKNKVTILDSSVLKKDKEIKKEAGSVRVYFPKEGDTLWEIAKKYHATVSALKEQNDISEGSVIDKKSLII